MMLGPDFMAILLTPSVVSDSLFVAAAIIVMIEMMVVLSLLRFFITL
jgi:hypothetical protein